jgi:hypothetical protein
MNLSGIPAKFPLVWAEGAASGYINTIPNTTATLGKASLTLGFPPANATPGSIPPFIQDWNGILNEITAWNQWQQVGGQIAYDATFQAAISGYPKGALVASTAGGGAFWLSTTDANTTNPEASGAGWVPVFLGESNFALDTGTAGALIVVLAAGTFTPPNGLIVSTRAKYTNAGATTLKVGGTAYPVTQGGVTLSGGEILANWDYGFEFDNGYWRIIWSGAGAVNIAPATAATHALPFGQAVQVLAPITSGTITPTALQTIVNPSPSGPATFTVAIAPAGARVRIYSSTGGAVTVNSTVSSGVPSFDYPDGTFNWSITLPTLGYACGIDLYSDGATWRAVTFGQTIVAPAVAANQAVQLGQFEQKARYYAAQTGSIGIAAYTTYSVSSVAITFPAFSKTGAFRIAGRLVNKMMGTGTAGAWQNFTNILTDGTNTETGAFWYVYINNGFDGAGASDSILTSATYVPGSTATFTQQVQTSGGVTNFTITGCYMELYVVEA